jgi:HAD superfamily hydrolase (TIGR01459 family)
LDGIGRLIERYDGFLLDQWGVLHDGAIAYPGARECLVRLREAGKKVAIVSNSGRCGEENATLMSRMGFSRELYDCLITAGDDARDAILNDPDPFYRTLGRRCLAFTRESEHALIDALGLTRVDCVGDADFLFALSMDSPRQSVAGWCDALAAAAARDLPMVCGNPDLWRVHADGNLYEAPGQVGRAYAELGGRVRYHGKPERRIYLTCLERLGMTASRILAVGDSLAHDVAGAAGSGIDAAFVASGVHRHDLEWRDARTFEHSDCLRLFEKTGIRARYVLPFFVL